MKLAMFCEAHADFRLASGLVDRVLRDLGPAWVVDGMETPEAIRTWTSDGFGQPFFDVHHLIRYQDALGVRSQRGHFDGKPGRAGAAMARKAFLIARALHKQAKDGPIDGVVLVWDVDHQTGERPEGVAQARDEARRWAPFQIVCGFPDPEGEAWLLAGFEPRDDGERRALHELQRELGFSPIREAGRLRDKTPGGPRDSKRVVALLLGEDLDREAHCWTVPALEILRDRGAATGLAAFLAELDATLRLLLAPRRRSTGE